MLAFKTKIVQFLVKMLIFKTEAQLIRWRIELDKLKECDDNLVELEHWDGNGKLFINFRSLKPQNLLILDNRDLEKAQILHSTTKMMPNFRS